MIIEEKNSRGQSVGFHNSEEGFYRSPRDFKKNQIFIHPKYKHAVALDVPIVKNCVKNAYEWGFGIERYKIQFLIQNFEKDDFIAEISVKEFLEKSTEFTFDKRKDGQNFTGYGIQRRIPMHELVRIYEGQKVLFEDVRGVEG